MMKLRKWNSLGKAEKLGIKNAFKSTLILAFPIFILIILLLICCSSIFKLSFINTIMFLLSYKTPLPLILFLALQFGCPIFYYFTIRKDAIDAAYDKCIKDCSKKLAKEMLVCGKPTKMKLIRTRDDNYKHFLLTDLPEHGVTYYAVLDAKVNTIAIYAMFPNESEKEFFDAISKEEKYPLDWIELEEFSSFCEIVDD